MNQLFQVLGQDVDFQVYSGAGLIAVQRGVRVVWGMMVKLTESLFISATVRLMPSTASEPFSTMYLLSAAGTWIVSHQLSSPNNLSSVISAVASTWPRTKWPSRRALARRGRSRFTAEPIFRSP